MKILPVGMKPYHQLPANNQNTGRINVQNTNNPLVNKMDSLSWQANFIPLDIAFEGARRRTGDFELKNIKGLNCPSCGDKMMASGQATRYIADSEGKKGEDLQAHLQSGIEYFKPFEADIAKTLIGLSKENPEYTTKDIVKSQAHKYRPILEKQQKDIIGDMMNTVKPLETKKRERISDILRNEINIIDNSNDITHFKRSKFIKKINNIKFLTDKDKEIYDKLVEQANTMPTTHNNVNAFFVKYARLSDSAIFKRLTNPSTATTEHVVPRALGGPDATDNYIPMCEECNKTRGHMSYNEWFKVHPEMPENLQNYLNKISEIIASPGFSHKKTYRDYPREIIEAVKVATEGELVLKEPPKKKALSPVENEKKPLTIEEKREALLEKYNELSAQLEDLKETRESFEEDEEYLLIVEFTHLQAEHEAAKVEKKNASSALTEQKDKVRVAERRYKKAIDKQKEKDVREAEEKLLLEKKEQEEKERIYDEKAAIEAELSQKLEALRKKIKFPSEIQAQIDEIKNNIEEMRSLAAQIEELSPHAIGVWMDVRDLETLEQEIQEKTDANRIKKSKINFSKPENIEATAKYKEARQKINIIESADENALRYAFKKPAISPVFILDDAKKVTEKAIQDVVSSNEAAQTMYEDDKIKTMKKKAISLKKTIAQKRAIEERILVLRKKLGELKQQGKEDYIRTKLAHLQERKAAVDKKFTSIDIDEQIKRTEEKLEEALVDYTSTFKN